MANCIPKTTVSGVVNIENGHKDIVDGLDDRSFSKPKFIVQVHDRILHVLAEFDHDLDTLLKGMVKKFGEVPLDGKALAL